MFLPYPSGLIRDDQLYLQKDELIFLGRQIHLMDWLYGFLHEQFSNIGRPLWDSVQLLSKATITIKFNVDNKNKS